MKTERFTTEEVSKKIENALRKNYVKGFNVSGAGDTIVINIEKKELKAVDGLGDVNVVCVIEEIAKRCKFSVMDSSSGMKSYRVVRNKSVCPPIGLLKK